MTRLLTLAVLLLSTLSLAATPSRFVLDMVHNNPGEPPTVTAFNDPQRLAAWGYSGQVINDFAQAAITYDAYDKTTFPEGSDERRWVLAKAADIDRKIAVAHGAKLPVYFFTDIIVLPKSLLAKHKDELCDEKGKIDLHRPLAQQLLRIQLNEIFTRFPGIDGLVIRTGEVYTHSIPHHAGNNPILRAQDSHIELLQILRDELCEKRHKMLFYRTWDFGNNFHVNPDYYLKVTDAIAPSPYLVFSVKHQAGDFLRMTPFNPTLMIGKHPQIVEVQCQLEAYGKESHPYYVANGVIDGWEEYAQIMKPGQPQGLRDITGDPHFAGIWTWSRGGGWAGPYLKNEFWCELNAYVISHFAQDPTRTEESIFNDFAALHGLKDDDARKFRQLALLSATAVLHGQCSTLADVNLWWARDNTIAAPKLDVFRQKNLVPEALAEKAKATETWRQIESLSRQIHFQDPALQEFVQSSSTYGRIKYALFEQIWKIQLLGPTDKQAVQPAIAEYDRLWTEWKNLKETSPSCATLYLEPSPQQKNGLAAVIDKYRTQP